MWNRAGLPTVHFNGKSGAVACEFNHSSWFAVFLVEQQVAKNKEAPDSCFFSLLRETTGRQCEGLDDETASGR
jgi:hypothetical protein